MTPINQSNLCLSVNKLKNAGVIDRNTEEVNILKLQMSNANDRIFYRVT